MRRIKPEQVALLDLGCLRSAGNGAEPINPRVLEAFYRTFAPCGFRWEAFCPAYGLAETTLMVSCCSPSLTPRVGRFQADALGENRVVEAGRRRRPRGRSRAAAASSASSTWPSSIPRPRPAARSRRSRRDLGLRPERGPGLLAARRRDRGHVPRFRGRHGGRAVSSHRRPRIHPGRRALRHQPHQGPDHRRGGEPLSPGHRVDRREVLTRTCAPAVSPPSRSRSTARSGS